MQIRRITTPRLARLLTVLLIESFRSSDYTEVSYRNKNPREGHCRLHQESNVGRLLFVGGAFKVHSGDSIAQPAPFT